MPVRGPAVSPARGARRTLGVPSWVPIAGVLVGAGWGSNPFTPLILVYQSRLGLSTGTLEALFGVYAVGLIPGLLVSGSWSDAPGRRPAGIAAAGLSLLATAALIAGDGGVAWLFVGRLLAGLGSGAAFAAGAAWLRETLVTRGGLGPAEISRRTAVSMTFGFGLGPLVAGLLAQWAPAPAVVPYLPHLALMLVVLASLARVPETMTTPAPGGGRRPRARLSAVERRRFRRLVLPVAPWVFAAPAIAFALLPSVLGLGHMAGGVALSGSAASLTALAGVFIQPLARRLDGAGRTAGGATAGLLVLAAGMGLAAVTVASGQTWLLAPCEVLLGSAYGLCLVAGLQEVQRLAPAGSLGALTAVYYTITYTGFAAPYLLTLASKDVGYSVLLLITAGLAVLTATLIRRAPSPATASERCVAAAVGRATSG